MRHTRITLALVVALVLFAGCGAANTSTGTTGEPANAGLCQRITTIDQSLTQLSTVGSNTTVGEVKAIQLKITTALGLLSKLPSNGGTTLSDLQSANNELASSISGLPDSATLGETAPRLQNFKAKVSKAQTATKKLSTVLKC